MNQGNHGEQRQDRPTKSALQQIVGSLSGLRYGSVNIIVQDGVVIQIDRTEKRRLRTREVTQEGPSL